jgi:hypothetical protein
MPQTKQPIQYYDEKGNPISIDSETPAARQYTDSEGNPIAAGQLPTVRQIEEVKAKAAPYLGRATAEMAPYVGSFYGPVGTGVGTMVKQKLKELAPGAFGEAPTGLDRGVDLGKDLILNNLLPWGVTKAIAAGQRLATQGRAAFPIALNKFPAVRDAAVRRLTGQIMGQNILPESQIIEEGSAEALKKAQELQANADLANKLYPPIEKIGPGGGKITEFSPEAIAAMKVQSDTFGHNRAGKMMVRLAREMQRGGDVAKSSTYKDITKEVLGDVLSVQNAQMVAGEGFTKELASNKLFMSGYSGARDSLDANKILNQLGGTQSEIYRAALLDSYEPMMDVLKSLKKFQDKGILDRVLNYSEGRVSIAAGLGLELLGAKLGIHGVGKTMAAVSGGVTITNRILAKMMENPQTAQLVITALNTPKTAPQAGMVAKALGKAVAGLSDITVGVPDR